jgi:hypothetical protein
MFRITIPVALFVAAGLAAHLISQETPLPAPKAASALVLFPSDRDEAGESDGQRSDDAADKGRGRATIEFNLVEEEEIERRVSERAAGAASSSLRAAAAVGTPTVANRAAASHAVAAASDPQPDPQPDPQNDEITIKIFQLQNVSAKSAAALIERLFRDANLIAESEERTNQLVVRGIPSVLNEIEAVLLRLDESKPRGEMGGMGMGGMGMGGMGMGGMMDGGRMGGMGLVMPRRGSVDSEPSASAERDVPRRESADILMRRLNDGAPIQVPSHALEPRDVVVHMRHHPEFHPHVELVLDQGHHDHEMAMLAEQIRRLREASQPDEGVLAELENKLRDRVNAAFDARQQTQRAELAVLEQQLASIEQAIAAREQQKDQLVKQRIEDLLSGKVPPEHWPVHPPANVPGWRGYAPAGAATPPVAPTAPAAITPTPPVAPSAPAAAPAPVAPPESPSAPRPSAN